MNSSPVSAAESRGVADFGRYSVERGCDQP